MAKGSIGVIDSGIGGLNVLKKIYSRVSGETFVYLGDNENVPYGNKSDNELFELGFSSVLKLKEYGVKCIVLGCNTLSLTVGKRIKEFSDLPIFPVYPPVERELISGRKCTLIGTERTCGKFKEFERLKIIPMRRLAEEIERNKFFLQNTRFEFETQQVLSETDTVILGCTHYELIQNKILDHFHATFAVSGSDDTANSVVKWLKPPKISIKDRKNDIIFIGPSGKENKKFWERVVIKDI